MSRLNRVMKEKDDAIHKKPKKNRELPVYNINGEVISSEKKRKQNKLAVFLLVIAAIAIVFYLPGFFMKDEDNTQRVVVAVDNTSIRKANDYLKNHPEEDFDKDGIINSEEVQKKMNPWNIDTDGDSLTDPCEINFSMTDPLVADSEILINAQKKIDKEKNKNLGSPLKIGNVALWAQDYTSKAIGSVVETPTGYRICGFSGYAQFPKEKGNYAYKVYNGVHTPLEYKEKGNVWVVHPGDEIELYERPLSELVEFSLVGKKFYAPANTPFKILTSILPHRGIFTANLKMKIDVEPDTKDATTATIDTPVFKQDSNFRFGKNNNSLNDLLYVRESIKKGCCIAVSLYNSNEGEFIGVIYGFDARGNFLIADQDSLKPIGKLEIKETAYKMMNEKGDIVSISYFDFGGIYYHDSNGQLHSFSSLNGDHISFFAASTGDGSGSQLLDDHLKDIVVDEPNPAEESTVGNNAVEEIKKQQLEQEQATATDNLFNTDTTEAVEPETSSEETEEENEEPTTESSTKKEDATTAAPQN